MQVAVVRFQPMSGSSRYPSRSSVFQHDESKDAFRSVQLTTCRMSKSGLGSGELSSKGSATTRDRKAYDMDEDCKGGKNMVG